MQSLGLSTQSQSNSIPFEDVPDERLVVLARNVIAQAIKDAKKGDDAALRWLSTKKAPLWAEACGVDQLWPPNLARLLAEQPPTSTAIAKRCHWSSIDDRSPAAKKKSPLKKNEQGETNAESKLRKPVARRSM